ncbi:E3 SUMO-protein ligase Nse2 (Mms21) protein [Dioscorea alata]|uniref:E3 SUMO-protein ligase Nse2 (Mms21) protein n=1 Tax=Dioscorea alata TaxID=55571 RepID=A0ACB7TW77_DIOAL|nr:E3 SUMO-protein ligase Nse2 (Mms21) protein [Dioscorea alata]
MASTAAASTSASRSGNAGTARITTTAATLSSDNQSLVAEIRKAIGMIKAVAVDLEKDQQSDKVNQLEDAVLELLATYDDCTSFSDAIQRVGSRYQPSDQVTDFKKLLEDEAARLKAASHSASQSNPLYRQFKEAVWNVHHAGQPMPGEEQEDIVMTTTQTTLKNFTCPITGKPVINLQNPVRGMDCRHIYEKDAIMHHIRTKNTCPVAGCPKILQAGRILCDHLLLIEIDELRSAQNTAVDATVVEDFTELDDDE